MTTSGKPRQPRKTQENKTGTLRYEHETETWHCAKCPKVYSKHNAVSAKSHVAAHTKADKRKEKLRKRKRDEKKQRRIRTKAE